MDSSETIESTLSHDKQIPSKFHFPEERLSLHDWYVLLPFLQIAKSSPLMEKHTKNNCRALNLSWNIFFDISDPKNLTLNVQKIHFSRVA